MGSEQTAGLFEPLTANEIASARRRIAEIAIRTPLIRARDGRNWLKMGALQPHGSYKIRSAANAIAAALETHGISNAIVSASAGNFGQAVAAVGAKLKRQVVIHVPENAARVKVDRLRELCAHVRVHSFDTWWNIMQTRATGDEGTFFHPVCDRNVIAGAATIGEEIAEDAAPLDGVFVPIGGGGLVTGIAQALKRVWPNCRTCAVECETATPLATVFRAGHPERVERPSFIDGMGSTQVLAERWPLLHRLIDEIVIVTAEEIENANRELSDAHHVIAEGAGAAALAAARKRRVDHSVAIVSGGNLDAAELNRILSAEKSIQLQ